MRLEGIVWPGQRSTTTISSPAPADTTEPRATEKAKGCSCIHCLRFRCDQCHRPLRAALRADADRRSYGSTCRAAVEKKPTNATSRHGRAWRPSQNNPVHRCTGDRAVHPRDEAGLLGRNERNERNEERANDLRT